VFKIVLTAACPLRPQDLPSYVKASTDEVVLLEVFAASSKFAALAGNFTHFFAANPVGSFLQLQL